MNLLKKALLFVLPLIIITAPYTIRNYIRFNCFQPFSELYAGYGYSASTFAYRNFLTAWGGSCIYWDKRSAGCYFEPHAELKLPCEFIIPDYALCEAYTKQDVERVRNLFIKHYSVDNTELLEDSIITAFNKLTDSYRHYRPFRYYIVSPLILAIDFVFHSGSYYLPINRNFKCYHAYQFFIKISQSFLYYFSLLIGFFGLIYLCFKQPCSSYMILIIPVYLIVFFPIVLKANEFRFFAPSYPFLILGTSVVLCNINRIIVTARK